MRGAKFRNALLDHATNTHTIEPEKEDDRTICADALLDVAKHMAWHSTEAYLRNMDRVEDEILQERNENANT